ncbi:LuxR C-terminal-related transcriptional regulator [Agrobacterium cavarae]|uniref:LuxR C-terminal-related transcriptional regulator n=1 Tax=Agrobacterium cavarae TaxID=2528239 RepID=UPI0028A65C6C|nr:LuxR C-terminal-related transcriptional regulator [Agrobacterium cavarae]
MNEEQLDHMASERWCIIHSLPAYEASSLGRIRCSADHTLMKSYVHKTGYIYIILPFTDDTGKARRHPPRQVHRLVLEAFRGPCPPDMEALHIDDTPTNNSIDNLQWNTKKANGAARRRTDRAALRDARHDHQRGIDAARVCELYLSGSSISSIGKALGCGVRTVKRILGDAGISIKARGTVSFDGEQILKLYKEGLDLVAIAVEIGCTTNTVRSSLRKAGVTIAPRWKLIDRDAVVQLHVDGHTNAAISKAVGCDPETVARILDGMRREGLIESVKRAARLPVDGDRVLELASHGMTNKEIAASMSVSEASVSKYLRGRKPAFQRCVIALHDDGKTATDIAHVLECKLSKVQYVLRKEGFVMGKSRSKWTRRAAPLKPRSLTT